MAGFSVLMLALMGLICSISYWISWEMQDKERRPGFTTMLWNDAARLLGRKSGGIPASESIRKRKTSVRDLRLDDSEVTDAGFAKLEQASPDALVER